MKTTTTPTQSIRSLLNRIIDYAGLFPPTKLDMAASARNYASYLNSDDSWMMGRLIVPVARLDEFERDAGDFLPRGEDAETWQISALTAAAGTPQFAEDLIRIAQFNDLHEDENAGLVLIDAIELRGESASAIESAMEEMPDDVFPFFEIPIDSDPRGLIAALVDCDAGLKVRTGGVTADLYPSSRNLARFIAACAAANIPFKATAGMHHPLRHHSELLNTKEFGFLNVFVAGCLALTHELGEKALVDLLEEESADAFTFDDDGLEWRGLHIKAESIEDVREEFAVSFGSCSFDEPREGLRAIKLL